MASPSELRIYSEAWRHSAGQVIELGRGLSAGEFSRSTDLPQWNVHDVYAHLAALEAALAGAPDDAGAMTTMRSTVITPEFAEIGVAARRGMPSEAVIDELATYVEVRERALQADPPTDPAAPATNLTGGLQWDWRTLLRNRAIDMWTHEQDIRRAVDKPGNLDGPGAHVTVATFAQSLPYIIGKRVGAPAGIVIAWHVAGDAGFSASIGVGEDRRARPVEPTSAAVAVEISTDVETFAMLASGRRGPKHADVKISGDHELASQILAAMVLTP